MSAQDAGNCVDWFAVVPGWLERTCVCRQHNWEPGSLRSGTELWKGNREVRRRAQVHKPA
jgi:hypothetical protein